MALYRVAVCEDDRMEGEQLVSLCRSILNDTGVAADVQLYTSADALDAAVFGQQTVFDLYLLDIQMEGMSGLELAQRLYNCGVRDKVIFVTGSAEYALSGYEAHPLHYLLKPVRRERLAKALALAQERTGQRVILFRRSRVDVPLPMGDIRWLESQNHNLAVRLEDRFETFSMTMSEAEAQVPEHQFFRCHRSFLVNLDWVKTVSRAEAILLDGQKVPVGRSFYTAFQSALIHHLNRQNRSTGAG